MLSSQFNELQVNTADNNAASEHDRSISSMSSAPLSPFMSNPSAFSDDYQPQRRGNINLTCSHEACLVCEYFALLFTFRNFKWTCYNPAYAFKIIVKSVPPWAGPSSRSSPACSFCLFSYNCYAQKGASTAASS